MKKTVIALYGTANIGKSMTLARLARQLLVAGATTNDNTAHNDYRAHFRYRNQTIGLQTYGDHVRLVNEGLDSFFQNQCDIIAIAAKGYGATNKAIENFSNQNGYRLVWARPYSVWDGSIPEDDIKSYSASHLLFMINDIISGTL